MAFSAIRFAAMGVKDAASPKRVAALVIAAVALPCLLAATVLAAYGNPFAGFRNVAVAVVDLDRGAQIDGEHRVLGEGVCDQLAARSDGMQWHFVSADEAQEGLDSGKFAMVCTIPEDFSESVASAQTPDPEAAKLLIEYDEAAGAQTARQGAAVLEGVRGAVGESIACGYWQATLSERADTGAYLAQSSETAQTLADGADMVEQGNGVIASGLAGVAQGAGALQSGLGILAQGVQGVALGAGALAEGLAPESELASGTAALAEGMDAAAQTMSVQVGALAAGYEGFSSALVAAVDGDAESGAPGLADAASAASQLSGGLGQSLGASAAAVGGACGQVADAAASVGRAQSHAQAAARSALAVANDPDATEEELRAALTSAAGALDSSAADQPGVFQLLEPAASSLAAADAALSAQADASIPGTLAYSQVVAGQVAVAAQGLDAGTAALSAALSSDEAKALSAGMAALADPRYGAAAVLSGAAQGVSGIGVGLGALSTVAAQVAEGAEQLSAGTAAYVGGFDAVSSGVSALASGSGQLGEGIALIADGNRSLADGLEDRSQGMAASDSVIRSQAEVLSSPVAVDDVHSGAVPTFGQGLAPYAAAMFLWLACLIIGFALRPLNMRMVMAGANPLSSALAGFIPMALAAAAGAVVLLAVVQLAAGLRVADPAAFFGVGIVAAAAFAAASQLLMAAFGRAGGLISVALLVLQAVCSGAAFPIQTAPSAFGALQAAMPLTYAAQGMQAAVLGAQSGEVGVALAVLAAFGAVCVGLTALVAMRRRTVTMPQLHPAAA